MTALQIKWSELVSRRVLVLGDVMLDRYTSGSAERVSPEAPVLVLRADEREVRPGGAASVAAMLRELGADVALAGVVGDDSEGCTLRRLLEESGVRINLFLTDASRPTTTKERFLGRAAGRNPHQILRVDHEVRETLAVELEAELARAIADEVKKHQALLISDYAKGVCTPGLLRAAIEAAETAKIPIIIDPARRSDYDRYRGASLVLPNRNEAELVSAMRITEPSDAIRAGQWLCDKYGFPACVVKLDADGLAIVDRMSDLLEHVPTRRRAVSDVTGAGDTVLAVVGLCQAAHVELEETARLANAAAGLGVERLGACPVTWSEIRVELHRGSEATELVTLDEMQHLAESYRRAGKTIVLTNGCFDLLHVGHVSYLQEAAELGDVLVIAINCDKSVQRLKGAQRPIIEHEDRAAMLAALECVDHVLVFDEDTPHAALRPDVLAKGGTYSVEHVVGREVVEGYGGRVCVTSRIDDVSTTHIVARIMEPSCT